MKEIVSAVKHTPIVDIPIVITHTSTLFSGELTCPLCAQVIQKYTGTNKVRFHIPPKAPNGKTVIQESKAVDGTVRIVRKVSVYADMYG